MLIAAAALIAALGGFAQSVSGFGFSLLSVPLLVPFIGAPAAVVAATLLSVLLAGGTAFHQRSHVHWRTVVVVSATALIGMPVGLLALHYWSTRWLSLLIGVVVIGMTLFLIRRRSAPPRPTGRGVDTRTGTGTGPGNRTSVGVGAAGALSGALLTATGMNGPPLVLAFERLGLTPRGFRASLQAAFVVQDVVAIAGFAVVGRLGQDAMIVAAAGVPGLLVGWLLGERLFDKINPAAFRRIVLTLLVASGTLAVVQAIIG